MCRLRRLGVVCRVLVLGIVLGAVAAGADPGSVRRLLLLVAAVGEEYREALDDAGRIVRPIEIEEARLLLAEARQHAGHLEPALAAEAARRLDAIARGIADTAPLAAVQHEVEGLTAWLGEATGVGAELLPPGPPSPERGRAVYAEHCVGCHGVEGRGDGPDVGTLARRPADFTDEGFMRGETPMDFAHVVAVGKRVGGMPAWGDVLSAQARWDVVSHVWTLRAGAARLAEGRGLYLAHCAGCHGATGEGGGPWAAALRAALPDFSALDAFATRTDGELLEVTSAGRAGTPMPGFARVLDEAALRSVVAFVRSLSLAPPAGAGVPAGRRAAAPDDAGEAVAAALALVEQAVAAHRARDPRAGELATDAYFRFEPAERRLGAVDPERVTRVEEAFLALRGALGADDAAAVDAAAARVREALAAADAALAPARGGDWALVLQSATIIFREGFEIVLVVGALLAWVTRSGNPGMRRAIHGGVAAGAVASALTAGALVTVFRMQPALAEALEGAAMLLASAVLFWVSYWIISKAEAERWQRFIRGKVEHALATGSGTSLAAAAFLAVYREGFETILFYQALFASAPHDPGGVVTGIVVGALLLAAVYGVFRWLGLRLPVRQFFLGTGALLCLMSAVFAGKGVHELQEAGLVGVTAVGGVSTIDVLGVYPTLESLAAQAVVLAAIVLGALLTLRPSRPGLARTEPVA